MTLMDKLGDLLIQTADYIYSMFSGVLAGEENPPEELEKDE